MTRPAHRFAVALLAAVAAGGPASAGGPLVIRTNGEPYTWGTSTIQYRTDGGPLSASVGNAAAIARVAAMFAVWEDVPSSSISYDRAGAIQDTGAFTDGNVSTEAEYNAVEAACNAGNQSPIVFDEAAEIFIALGVDETSVIGFAGPCALDPAQGRILSGIAVMNGLFQDGNASPVPDLSAAEFDATFVHDRLPIEGHGTGCTLASAIAANLCRGLPLVAAVEAATDYIERALRGGYRPGRGEVVVLDHFGASPLRTA